MTDRESIPGLRAVAALLVIVATVVRGRWPIVSIPGQMIELSGVVGLALFCLLAGFLAARPDFAALETGGGVRSWGSFAVDRVLRVMPTYAVVALAYVGTGIFFSGPNRDPSDLWSIITFTHVYRSSPWPPGTGLWWSLACLMGLFAAYPLIAQLISTVYRQWESTLARANAVRAFVVASFVVAAAWRWGVSSQATTLRPDLWPFAYLDWFVSGVGLAMVSVRLRSGAASPPPLIRLLADNVWFSWLCALGVTFVVAQGRFGAELQATTTGQRELRHLGILAAAVLVCVPVLFGDGAQTRSVALRAMGAPSVLLVGSVSFAMFLWFPAARSIVERQALNGNAPSSVIWQLPIVYGLAAVMGWVSSMLIERPVQRWRRGRVPTLSHSKSQVQEAQ